MATIIIFFITLIIAVGLIARKAWHIRKGEVVTGSYEETDWTDLSAEAVRNQLIELFKFGVHHFVLFALRIWILVSNNVKGADRHVKTKLTKVLHKNGHYPAGGRPSHFLKNIRDHKDAVSDAIQREGEN